MFLFYITPRFPYPLTKGDQLRAYQQIKHLSKSHKIILFSITEEKVKDEWIRQLMPYCVHIETFRLTTINIIGAAIRRTTTSLPFQSIYYFNTRALKKLRELYSQYNPDTLIFQLIRMAPYAAFFPTEKCIIDLMDCFSYHYLLRGQHPGSNNSWFYKMEYKRVKNYETQLLQNYTRLTVISNKDKELLPGETTHVTVVPNGVHIPDKLPDVTKAIDVLFLGNLSYEPNIAAAEFLTKKVLPLIKMNVSVVIAGKSPGKRIQNLVQPGIKLIADVENIFDVLSMAKVFVAPMFLSTGVQNKVLEAMSAGLIVITTPNAAAAIGVVPGVHVLTAVSPEEFATLIVDVLKSPGNYSAIPQAARIFLLQNFQWEQNIEILDHMIR